MFTTPSASTAAPIARTATRQGLRSPAKRGALLPPKIGSALATINTDPRFRALPLTARNVLMFIVQVTDAKDPERPSFAFKDTIANHLGIGEATVYRMLNLLLEDGLIERLEQERKSRNGRFTVARVRLTRECCAALRLINREPHNDDPGKRDDNLTDKTNKETKHDVAAVDNVISEPTTICIAVPPSRPAVDTAGDLAVPVSPAREMIDGHMNILPTADQRTQSSKHSRPAGRQKPSPGQHYLRLPREFLWLIDENRLTAPQICRLMREFSSRGKRLGDAVSVLAKRLREIPKDKAYAYLAALAKGQTDFAWLRREQAQAAAVTRQKAAVQKQAKSLEGMAGKYLFSANQTHLFLLRGSHAEAWWLDGGAVRRGSQPVNADFAEAFAKGRLVEVSHDQAEQTLARWR